VHTLAEPDNRDANNRYTLDERRDRVCDGGGGGKDDECYYVLGEVNSAIHEEIVDN
jgi:hypothetical protein